MSQFPRYMNQYMDLLSNVVAGKQVVRAVAQNKAADGSFFNSVLSFGKNLGINISWNSNFASNLDKMKFYQVSLNQWREATELEKPFVFVSNISLEIVRTLDYTFVFQKDTKSLVYAFIGIFVGAIAYKLFVKAPYYLFFAKERKKINRGMGRSV